MRREVLFFSLIAILALPLNSWGLYVPKAEELCAYPPEDSRCLVLQEHFNRIEERGLAQLGKDDTVQATEFISGLLSRPDTDDDKKYVFMLEEYDLCVGEEPHPAWCVE